MTAPYTVCGWVSGMDMGLWYTTRYLQVRGREKKRSMVGHTERNDDDYHLARRQDRMNMKVLNDHLSASFCRPVNMISVPVPQATSQDRSIDHRSDHGNAPQVGMTYGYRRSGQAAVDAFSGMWVSPDPFATTFVLVEHGLHELTNWWLPAFYPRDQADWFPIPRPNDHVPQRRKSL